MNIWEMVCADILCHIRVEDNCHAKNYWFIIDYLTTYLWQSKTIAFPRSSLHKASAVWRRVHQGKFQTIQVIVSHTPNDLNPEVWRYCVIESEIYDLFVMGEFEVQNFRGCEGSKYLCLFTGKGRSSIVGDQARLLFQATLYTGRRVWPRKAKSVIALTPSQSLNSVSTVSVEAGKVLHIFECFTRVPPLMGA